MKVYVMQYDTQLRKLARMN